MVSRLAYRAFGSRERTHASIDGLVETITRIWANALRILTPN
jgi:hypothetical protein